MNTLTIVINAACGGGYRPYNSSHCMWGTHHSNTDTQRTQSKAQTIHIMLKECISCSHIQHAKTSEAHTRTQEHGRLRAQHLRVGDQQTAQSNTDTASAQIKNTAATTTASAACGRVLLSQLSSGRASKLLSLHSSHVRAQL